MDVWHDDVIYYDVDDAVTGERIGGIYLDLYPRDDKYKHAAAWPVRGVSRRAARKPISVLVTNFDRKGLTHSEVETLLHEFGHVMHGVLSQTEYNQHSGTSVERDFVEAPSQMYEEWASRMESLALMRDHCTTCPLVDESLVQRIRAAKKFGSGIDYGRQLLYASYDMALAGEGVGSGEWGVGEKSSISEATPDPRNPRPGSHAPHPTPHSPSLNLWQQMEGATPMGTIRHRVSGHVRSHRQWLCGRLLRLHVGESHCARSHLGVRRRPHERGEGRVSVS